MTTADGQYSLNDLLDNLAKACMLGYNQELARGIPEKNLLKKYLDSVVFGKSRNNKVELMSLFERFISGDIKNRGKDKSKNTLQNYATAKKHLEYFEKWQKQPLAFESVNLDFFYKFTGYLKSVLELKQNSIAKDISILKTVMTEAVDMGLTTNMQFRHKKFSSPEIASDSIYLTDADIRKFYKFDLSDNTKLERVRDLFIFGCCTGLRYSDYSNIKAENIIIESDEKFIKLFTQKTKELVIIPCNPMVLEIFEKYKSNLNQLPTSISSQKFNSYIKQAAELAGLKDKGRLLTEPEKALWENISSHTARRSFATNLYLEGFPPYELMKITGHRTETSFRKYIKITKIESARKLAEHIKNNWSAKIMKVAM